MCISYATVTSQSLPQQTFNIRHHGRPHVVLLFTWLLTALLLTLFYSSNLLANLVKVEHEKPVDTIQVHPNLALLNQPLLSTSL